MIDLVPIRRRPADAARFTHAQATNELDLESTLYDLIGAPLKAMGHHVESANGDDMEDFRRSGSILYGVQDAASGRLPQSNP